MDSCLVDDGLDTEGRRLLLYWPDLHSHLGSRHAGSLQIHTTKTHALNFRRSVPVATAPDPSSDMFSYEQETAEVVAAHIVYEVPRNHKLPGTCSDVDETGLQ